MREAWQQTKANHWNNDRYQVITLRQTKISQNAYYKAFLYRLLDFLKKKYNAYGLSPQVGIAYRFQHVGCELKYKYSLCRVKSDVRWIESDGSVNEG